VYDWLHLYEHENCRLQVRGNDHTGYELINKLKPNHNFFRLTLPLLTNKSGKKIGKSTGNAIWLDENELSKFEFHQYFFNTSDQMAETYLKLFTFLPISEIQNLMAKHRVSLFYFLKS
jgi:tyrosyl-tRNA synthetase